MSSHPEENSVPLSLAELINGIQSRTPTKRTSERGELLKYFSHRLQRPIGFVAHKLTGLSVRDLYHIKSSADSYEREGKGAWGKAFYGMLKTT